MCRRLLRVPSGWDKNLGPFGTALRQIGTLPLVLCALLFLGGVYYVMVEIRQNS